MLPGLPGLPGHRKRNPAPHVRCCWVPGWFGGNKADPGGLRTAHRPDSETGPAGTPSTNTGSICSEGSCSHAEGWLLGRGLLHRSRTGQTHQPLPQTRQPPLISPLGMLGELQNKRTPSICDVIAGDQIGPGPRTRTRTRTPKPLTHSSFPTKHRGRKRYNMSQENLRVQSQSPDCLDWSCCPEKVQQIT